MADEIVVSLRLEEGNTRQQFQALNAALVDVRSELNASNKALRDNAKERDALNKKIQESGEATEQEAARLRRLNEDRVKLKKTNADLVQSFSGLSAQFREARNDVSGLTDAGLRFRDVLTSATVTALKEAGVIGQLSVRLDHLRESQDRLTAEYRDGKISAEQYKQQIDAIGREAQQTSTQLGELNGKVDRITTEFREGRITAEQYRAGVASINSGIEKQSKALSGAVSNLKSYALGMFGAVAAVAAVGRVFGDAADTVLEFDQAMAGIRALGDEFAAQADTIAESLIRIGPSLGRTPKEAAEGFTELAKAGLDTATILGGGLSAALALSAAGGIAVGDSAEYMASALAQFNLEGEDAAHVSDLLAKGANIAQGGVEDMAQAMAQAGLVANGFGLSIDETIGGLTAFANAGLIGSDAGTSLRSALVRLENPTKQARDAMQKYGIEVTNAKGEFLSLAQIAGNLRQGLAGVTEAQRTQTLAMIFGQDALRVANILYEEGREGIEKYTEAVNDSGFALRTAAEQLNSVSGDFDKLGAAWDAFILSVDKGEGVISRVFSGAAQAARQLLQNLSRDFSDAQQEIFDLTRAQAIALGASVDEAEAAADKAANAARDFAQAARAGFAEDLTAPVVERIEKISVDYVAAIDAAQGYADTVSGLRQTNVALSIAEEEAQQKRLAYYRANSELAKGANSSREAELSSIANAARAESAAADETVRAIKKVVKAREAVIEEAERRKAVEGDASAAAVEGDEEQVKSSAKVAASISNVAGSVADLSERIKELKAQQAQSTDSAQFATYQAQIDELDKSIRDITGETLRALEAEMKKMAEATPRRIGIIQPDLGGDRGSFDPEAARKAQLKNLSDREDQFRIDQIRGIRDFDNERMILEQKYAAGIIKSREELNAELERLDREQTAAQENELNQVLGAFSEIAQSINNIDTISTNKRIAEIDRRISAEEEAGNDASTLRAERDREERELAIRTANRERAVAILTIAVQTAAAIAKAVSSSAAGDPYTLVARIALAVAAVVAAMAKASASISAASADGFATGGEVKRTPSGKGGRVEPHHGKVIRRANGDNRLITAYVGEVILNERQKATLQRIAGPDIFARIGVPGMGRVSQGMRSNMPIGFATGGIVPLTAQASPETVVRVDNSNVLAETLGQEVIVRVTDINKAQGRVARVRDRSRA